MVHCWPRSKYHDHICYYIYTARVIAILFDMKVAHAIICFPFIEMSRYNCTKQVTLKDTSALVGLFSRHESPCAKLGTCRSLSCIFGVSLSKKHFYFFVISLWRNCPGFRWAEACCTHNSAKRKTTLHHLWLGPGVVRLACVLKHINQHMPSKIVHISIFYQR